MNMLVNCLEKGYINSVKNNLGFEFNLTAHIVLSAISRLDIRGATYKSLSEIIHWIRRLESIVPKYLAGKDQNLSAT